MTLLIKNVQVLGTERKFGEKADVFVSGDKISAIGDFSAKKADEIIEGQGVYCAPGFIDANTDSDHYLSLFDYPSQDDFVCQGVTTIVGGNCGASLAPLLYGSLESIQKWTDVGKFNVDWHTMGEFLSLLDRKPLGINFATLVGHSTIRRALIGEALRDLTKNELTVFGETMRRALTEGAFGFSTGLGYVHSRQTPYQEIKTLAEIVAQYHGIYATHLRRGGEGVFDSVKETIQVAEETRVKTIVSHFLPLRGNEKEYEAALALMEELPQDLDFHFDVYPFETTVLPLYTFLPTWAQNGGIKVMQSNIGDKWLESRIIKDMSRIDPSALRVAYAPGNEVFVGRSLGDLMDLYSLRDARTALLKFMAATKLKASMFYKNVNGELILRALKNPRAFVSSNAASLPPTRAMEKLDRATKTFPRFLSLVEQEGLLPLDEAIRKLTTLPAKKFNLRNRGEIKEGNFADLTGFKNGEIKFTVVNGVLAWKDGALQGRGAGRALRHYGY